MQNCELLFNDGAHMLFQELITSFATQSAAFYATHAEPYLLTAHTHVHTSVFYCSCNECVTLQSLILCTSSVTLKYSFRVHLVEINVYKVLCF
jgi:hypothetical protein